MERLGNITKKLRGQRGSVVIIFATSLVVLMGLAAVAVDLTNIHRVKAELQNAADAAALAGAGSIDITSSINIQDAAVDKAKLFASKNIANAALIQEADAAIDTGYWHLEDRNWVGSTKTEFEEVPAVRATISLHEPLKLFFAPIWNIPEKDLSASAVAVVTQPSSGNGFFPFAIDQDTYSQFYDINTKEPYKDANGDPIVGFFGDNLKTPYPKNGQGTWVDFTEDNPGASVVARNLEYGVADTTAIGNTLFITKGVKNTLWDLAGELRAGQDVAIPVVTTVYKLHSKDAVDIIVFAGFHIESVTGSGATSHITGNFISPESFPGLNPGGGMDDDYAGVLSRPTLVY